MFLYVHEKFLITLNSYKKIYFCLKISFHKKKKKLLHHYTINVLQYFVQKVGNICSFNIKQKYSVSLFISFKR